MDDSDIVRASVTLKMVDGNQVEGDMILPIGGVVERTLNNDAKFILFSDDSGRRYIAKNVIAEVAPKR